MIFEGEVVVSRVMRKIDSGIWRKSITEVLCHLLITFQQSGRKGSRAASAARLALDPL